MGPSKLMTCTWCYGTTALDVSAQRYLTVLQWHLGNDPIHPSTRDVGNDLGKWPPPIMLFDCSKVQTLHSQRKPSNLRTKPRMEHPSWLPTRGTNSQTERKTKDNWAALALQLLGVWDGNLEKEIQCEVNKFHVWKGDEQQTTPKKSTIH